MKYLFPQVGNLPVDNLAKNAEAYVRDAKITGLIEKQLSNGQSAVWLFASGVPGMAHMLENGHGRSILNSEFLSISEDSIQNVRAIKLPDVAGRLALLAFESKLQNTIYISDAAVWNEQVEQWGREQWSGLVEIKSETRYGLALFWKGKLKESDTFLSTPQDSVAIFSRFEKLSDAPWEVLSYSLPASEQSYQYTALRHGAMNWMNMILSRYQELVGHKLLQTMDRELNLQVKPWLWNIVFEEVRVVDSHFFIHLKDAEQAYRALLMSMGSQMNIVIGNILTQRILNETFELTYPDEREILQSMRLVPAAFSE